MIKIILTYIIGMFQLIVEFFVFFLILFSIFVKPFLILSLFCHKRMPECTPCSNLSSLVFEFFFFEFLFSRVIFSVSLITFISLVISIYYLMLTNNLFFLVYLYLYTLDVYIYNPLGIPTNILNIAWGKFYKP